jgi:CubicO group peptidase (beta-lactamase class C family)
LGAIIEKLSGKSYAKYIKERIFNPLGMENSHYGNFIKNYSISGKRL